MVAQKAEGGCYRSLIRLRAAFVFGSTLPPLQPRDDLIVNATHCRGKVRVAAHYVTLPMSAMEHIIDSTRTLRHVRKVHEMDMPKYLGDFRCWVNS
jgi:hypothetical protein